MRVTAFANLPAAFRAAAVACLLAAPMYACAASCPVSPADRPPANAAEAAERTGDNAAAAKLYASLLDKAPGDPLLTVGAVRMDISTGDIAAAEAALSAATAQHAQTAPVLTAQGLLDFYRGNIPEADQDFFNARRADPCFAPAYLGGARIAALRAMYATRAQLIKTAHQLDPAAPAVASAFHSLRTPAERLKDAKAALGPDSTLGPEQRKQNEEYVAVQERMLAHPCRLEGAGENAAIPLTRLLNDPTHTANWGIDTKIGSKAVTLLVDSGASGLLISRPTAEAAGLTQVAQESFYGFGDKGPQSGYLAFAPQIQIGGLVFHDCAVHVSNSRDVAQSYGLVGTDVFRSFLVTVDYPAHQLRLAPLPGPPPAAVALETDSSAPPNDDAPHDAYSGPELKGYTTAYRIGHDILVPSHIDKKGPFLLVLDTGDAMLNITEATAKAIGAHATRETISGVGGLSGNVEKIDSISHAQLQFGGASVEVERMLVFDIHNMERGLGTTVAGFLGGPILQRLAVSIDYRDNMVKFEYDPKHDRQAGHQLDPLDKACFQLGQCEVR